ncbi:MAG: hypothetical protein AAGB14_09110 [Verrucomicrobiota bacterium]
MRTQASIGTLKQKGFALIVSISTMILLVLLAVGLLSLSLVSTRSSRNASAAQIAKANARLSLTLAISELQKHAGSDQRVTAPAGVLGENIAQPNWTGVWSTKGDESVPAWLISGNEAAGLGDLDETGSHPTGYQTPNSDPTGETYLLFNADGSSGDPADRVEAPLIDINPDEAHAGRYAWWISDEGCKARVDLEGPAEAPANNYERIASAGIPTEPGLHEVDQRFELISGPDASIDKSTLISASTLDLALNDRNLSKRFSHDLTIGGHGLPVNVVDGGTKSDLSVIFDSSQTGNANLLVKHLGARPSKRTQNGHVVYHFDNVSDPETFYLSRELREAGSMPVGPNWGILYNYGRLWQNVRNEECKALAMSPKVDTELRLNNWAPYSNYDGGDFRRDVQHTNSSITPVLCLMQMGFRLTAEEVSIPPTRRGQQPQIGYQMQLQMKPLIGIWNPYNVKISDTSFSAAWALYPYLHIGINTPDGKAYRPHIWMRENWKSGDGIGSATSFGRNFRFETETVDLEPGEVRLFSVANRTDMAAVNQLVSTWNENGAFTFDLSFSKFDGDELAGQKIIVPKGSVAWYGNVFLEDTQNGRTGEYFDERIEEEASASWITFSGSGGTIHRVSDIWTTPKENIRRALKYQVPEPVISEWGRTGGRQTADQLPVEFIAGSPYHMGTWRIHSRTSTEANDAENGAGSQRLRTWVDSNPRFGSTNPAWDGSRAHQAGRGVSQEGYHFISPFIGSSYQESYDNGPRGRGKVAEGQNEAPAFPEAIRTGGRYRGFGGLTTSSSGQTHFALFDVPRAPLVSLGQLQHAQLSRYGFEPSLPFGNSYANLRVPLDRTFEDEFADIPNFRMVDLSHSLNESLWDGYFFSTVGRDYFGPGRGADLDRVFSVADLVSGEKSLPNPRYRFNPVGDEDSINDIVKRDDEFGAEAISARIAIDGAFNVNSTSKEAWKAVLASMADYEFPVISSDGGNASWENSEAIRFPRFGHVMQAEGWSSTSGPTDPSFWQGFRKIEADDLDKLAEEIVSEVRERGPFRSFADFVNRDPDSERSESQLKGALQTALDNTVNQSLEGDLGDPATNPKGSLFSGAISNENTTAGFAGYLMQGDILQSLAPILQVRSDYFRIRAVGQAIDPSGRVLATAVCEAYVQRSIDYIDPEDEPHLPQELLTSKSNEAFGRRFRITSFRWLNADEV